MGQAAVIIGSPSADDPPARRTFSRRLLPLHTTPVLRVETGTVELRYLELAVGGDPSDLSYGNTIKRSADIAYAFECGVRQFTVDSPGELIKVMTLAPGATVLVRITTNGAGADWALGRKFGCPENEAAALLGESPAIGDYGAAIAASVRRHLGEHPPALMAEPGRYVVADAGVLETEVVLVAERGGVRWVFLDAGLFTGLVEATDESIRFRIEVHRDGMPLGGLVGPVVLAGPTCDSLDVLYERYQYRVPLDLRPGDRLTLLSAGAYTATYSTVGFNGFARLREVYR